MEIVITWSWFSFIVGIIATISFLFWGAVWVAARTAMKKRKNTSAADSSIEKLFEGWSNKDVS